MGLALVADASRPHGFDLDAFAARQEEKDLLRFITCGSVDDGKSSLIGRLLWESKLLFEDQVRTLEAESKKVGTRNGEIDYALLVDGLAAEREQGITIDVAYRFFTTDKRKFIVADTPGHEQYTRNMATGASTADLAVILVDARKGLTPQTRRHSIIVSLLGVKEVVVAVNKMDLVGWSGEAFAEIEADYRVFARGLGFRDIVCIPVAAIHGDNVVEHSARMAWYRGPTLLEHLESVEIGHREAEAPLRLPVQWVNRPNADFRGFAGLLAGGTVRPVDKIRVLPMGSEARVARIVAEAGDLDLAQAGQSVTLTLDREIDVSRGALITAADAPARIADRLSANMLWLSETALDPARSYTLKLGPATATARVAPETLRIDLVTLERLPHEALALNDIAEVDIALDRPLAFDLYADNRDTGSFILIDRETNDTVAMGMISGTPMTPVHVAETEPPPAHAPQLSIHIPPATEKPWRSFAKAVSWRITGSIDTFVLAMIFTGGEAEVAAAISLAEVVTKLILYYGHERIWAHLPVGLVRPGIESPAWGPLGKAVGGLVKRAGKSDGAQR